MIKQFNANAARLRRHRRIRKRMEGSVARPRLNVFRSGQHIYAQVIDDTTGQTLAAASSLEATLRDFKSEDLAAPAKQENQVKEQEPEVVEVAVQATPTKGKGAKTAKAPTSAKGTPQKGSATSKAAKGGKAGVPLKTVLPTAQKGEKKTPVEALAAIANNRKVAVAREVGKLVAQRAKEKGISQVVFDRGGYTYHGRIASLAEGAREVGLDF